MENAMRKRHSGGVCPPSTYGLARVPISWGDAEKGFCGGFSGFGGLQRVPKADFLVWEKVTMENVM